MENYENNITIQQSIDRRNRKFAGGNGQLPQGTDNIGDYSVDGFRGKDNRLLRGSLNKGYKQINNVRGKILLNHRVNIDNSIAENLKGNPYINNGVHKSKSKNRYFKKNYCPK